MKRIILSAAALLSMNVIANAQTPTITNGTFETWTNVTQFPLIALERPNGWYGSDQIMNHTVGPILLLQSMDFDSNKQLYKDTDKYEGTYAAKLMTKHYGDTMKVVPVLMTNAKQNIDFAALLSGGTSGTANMLNLFKFTEQTPCYGKKIDSVTAYVKTPATNGDSAAAFVLAYKKITADSMVLIGQGAYNIPINAGSGAYTKISIPVMYLAGEATDSMVVGFASSGIASDTGFTVNNTLFVDKVEVFSSNPNSISKVKEANLGFAIYPNPATDKVYFENKNMMQNTSLIIQNAVGQILHMGKLNAGVNFVNIQNYAAGTYFYEIYNADGSGRQTGKFVK